MRCFMGRSCREGERERGKSRDKDDFMVLRKENKLELYFFVSLSVVCLY